MEYLHYLSPNSVSGVILFLVGSLLTIYLNLKVYKI
ncbi:PEP-CTERM protein-sorting domain-containing protein [Mesobacillus thioparans]